VSCTNILIDEGGESEMKRLIVVLAVALACALVAAPTVIAIKPLRGAMELDYYPDNPIWRGTISGDISGKMFFTNVGTGKQGNQAPGMTIHFGEIWLITDAEDNMLLTGTDEGVVSLDGSEYRMNGEVVDASEAWEHLTGRKVHMSGYITWDPDTGMPATAPGTFRIN
jgi:hypothetical protein